MPPSSVMIASTDMEPPYFTPRETVKVYDLAGDFPATAWKISVMAADNARSTALRLQVMHRALRISQRDVSRATGIAESRYSQYATGARPLTLLAAMKIADSYGVTLDYLFRDNTGSLPNNLVQDFLEARAALMRESAAA